MVRFNFAPMVLVLALSTAAHADTQGADEKSTSIAVSLSVGVTTAGAITLMSGDDSLRLLGVGLLFFGPSTGRWYAGEAGLGGLGLRALAAGGMVYGLVTVLRSECDEEDGPCSDSNGGAGAGLMLGGAALWLGSTIADVVLAERAARRWNENHALALTPTVGNTTGLALTGRF